MSFLLLICSSPHKNKTETKSDKAARRSPQGVKANAFYVQSRPGEQTILLVVYFVFHRTIFLFFPNKVLLPLAEPRSADHGLSFVLYKLSQSGIAA